MGKIMLPDTNAYRVHATTLEHDLVKIQAQCVEAVRNAGGAVLVDFAEICDFIYHMPEGTENPLNDGGEEFKGKIKVVLLRKRDSASE